MPWLSAHPSQLMRSWRKIQKRILSLPRAMRVNGWESLATVTLEFTGISTFTIARMPWMWSMHKLSPNSRSLALMFTVRQTLIMISATKIPIIALAMEISRRWRSASTRAQSHSTATLTEIWTRQCTSLIKPCSHSGTGTIKVQRQITSGKYTLTCSIRLCRRASAQSSTTRGSSSASEKGTSIKGTR